MVVVHVSAEIAALAQQQGRAVVRRRVVVGRVLAALPVVGVAASALQRDGRRRELYVLVMQLLQLVGVHSLVRRHHGQRRLVDGALAPPGYWTAKLQ